MSKRIKRKTLAEKKSKNKGKKPISKYEQKKLDRIAENKSNAINHTHEKFEQAVDRSKRHCHTCGGLMNQPNDGTTKDCGGDCLMCMATVVGDPDCIAELKALEALEE